MKKAKLSEGRIVVSQSAFDSVGESRLRQLNGTPKASIIVIPDKKFNKMTPSQRGMA